MNEYLARVTEAYYAGRGYHAACQHYGCTPTPIPLGKDDEEGMLNGILELDVASLEDWYRNDLVNAFNKGASGQ